MLFGVEAAFWSTAAKKAGKWHRGFLEAAARFMVRWHEAETDMSRKWRGRGQQEKWQKIRPRECGGRGGGRRSKRETAVHESRQEMADRVAMREDD